jgi:phage replication initiation protein
MINSNYLLKFTKSSHPFFSTHITFDILLTPSDYFLGAYPCFAFLKTELTTPQRIKVKEKEAKIAYHRSIEIVKNQAGKYITFLRRFFQLMRFLLHLIVNLLCLRILYSSFVRV